MSIESSSSSQLAVPGGGDHAGSSFVVGGRLTQPATNRQSGEVLTTQGKTLRDLSSTSPAPHQKRAASLPPDSYVSLAFTVNPLVPTEHSTQNLLHYQGRDAQSIAQPRHTVPPSLEYHRPIWPQRMAQVDLKVSFTQVDKSNHLPTTAPLSDLLTPPSVVCGLR